MKIDRIEAHALAGRILLSNLIRSLNDSSSTSTSLAQAAKPFFAIQFGRDMFKVMEGDAYRFSVSLTRLRRSALPGDLYKALIIHVKDFLTDDSAAIPYVFEEWRRLLVRSDLGADLEFSDWIPILNNFAAYGIRNPSDVALSDRADIALLTSDPLTAPSIWKLWRLSAMTAEQSDGFVSKHNLAFCSNASSLAASFRHKSIDSTVFAQNHRAARSELELDSAYDNAGPAARIRLLRASRASPDVLTSFLNTGAQINTLRQVQGSLRCVSAGVQCWASFCDLVGAPYFPPTSSLILRWSTIFKPGRTFGGYVAHLAKACQLLNIAPSWYNSSVRGVIHGLENAQDVSFKFENYIGKRLFRLILAHETLSSEFGRLCFLAYVFILRLPSEALPAVRASPEDDLIKRSPLSAGLHSLIGMRFLPDDSERVVLKLRSRKATRGGAILMRPCFCDADDLGGKGICPVHDFWPAVISRSLWGEPLFPSLRTRNINRILKGMLRSMGVDESERYSTHAFRRGASMELKNSGSNLAQILKTVGWNSAAFRAYLSFVEDEEVNIRSILVNHDAFESSDEEENSSDSLSPMSETSSGTDTDDIPLNKL